MRDPDDGLRALFVKHLPGPKQLQTVELGMTSRGVPDLYYCLDGVTGWVEAKATRHWTVNLRPGQVGWLLTHVRHGGRAVIAVRRRGAAGSLKRLKSQVVFDELYLLRARYAAELKAGGLRWAILASSDPRGIVGDTELAGPPPVLGFWEGGPRGWDWFAVRHMLRVDGLR